MPETTRCPRCGGELNPDDPAGLCPQCLLEQGFGSAPAPNSSWNQSAAGTGTLEPAALASSRPAPPPTTPFVPSGRFVPPEPADLARCFPSLEILELLGRGGMGAVYKARQPALDRFVALKVLPPEVSRDPSFALRFTREARALAKLGHQHIVAVHDFGQVPAPVAAGAEPSDGGLYYFLMEFVDGANLRHLIAQRQLGPSEAMAIVPQICEALQYAHDEGVVHRDIKPENILIDKKGRVKIADFGLAKLLSGDADPPRRPPAQLDRLTETGQVMGTPHYMAPEQLERPLEVDHRADIYSLGVVFYEMLTGELPIGRFAPPSHKIQIDVRLDDVVLRSLEKEPERRYQHASEVKTDVEIIARPEPAAATRSASTVADRPAGQPAGEAVAGSPPAPGLLDLIDPRIRRAIDVVKQEFTPFLVAFIFFLLAHRLVMNTVGMAVALAGGEGLDLNALRLFRVCFQLAFVIGCLLYFRIDDPASMPFWSGSAVVFCAAWLATYGLMHWELAGLAAAVLPMSVAVVAVLRWLMSYVPPLCEAWRQPDLELPRVSRGWGWFVFMLGWLCLAPALYKPSQSRSDYVPPSQMSDWSFVTEFKGAEHRLLRLLRAFKDQPPRAALMEEPGPVLLGGDGSDTAWPIWQLVGAWLLLSGLRRMIAPPSVRSSWNYGWRPALIVFLALLAGLYSARSFPLHLQTGC